MKYKVWVQIEECDDETDHYENVSEPDELGCFDTEEEAVDFMNDLPGPSRGIKDTTLQQQTISDLMDERWKARAEVVTVVTDMLEALLEYKRMYEAVEPRGGWQGVYDIGNIVIAKAKKFLDKKVPSPVSEAKD